jgi:hypothetical protein
MRIACVMGVLVVCSVFGWSQGTPGVRPHSVAPSAAASRSLGQAKISDAQLEAAIRAKFAKSKSANKFTVRVQGGVATIEGKTDVVQHKGVATRMAKTAGAVAVKNQVQVSEAARQKAAGNLEQGRRRAQVKRGDVRDARK